MEALIEEQKSYHLQGTIEGILTDPDANYCDGEDGDFFTEAPKTYGLGEWL